MTGGETPETCWATYKRQVINLWNCCILLVELFESYDDARTLIIFNYALQPLRLIVRSGLEVPIFRPQVSPTVSPRESSQRRKVELWARNVREFCLNADFHVTFRGLLHAVRLQHGTDGFTSPPKKGVLKIFFFALKIRRLRPGTNTRTLVPKASTLPLDHGSRYIFRLDYKTLKFI